MTQVNAIGWFDLYVNDMDRAVNFYQEVLEVKLEEMIDPTGHAKMMSFPTNENSMSSYGALGALVKVDEGRPGIGGTMIYFNSQDCSIEESKVEAAGGKVIRTKYSIGEFGWVALCEDTEGNVFGLNSMK